MRVHTLDAVRGVAALLVVVSHLYASLPDRWVQRLAPLTDTTAGQVLVAGRPMVILFFVLSGVVLTVSLRQHPLGYGRFVVRRLFRIYPPFAASILAAALLVALLDPQPIPELSDWFNRDIWSQPLTLALVLEHLAMVGTPAGVTLDGPMWSLVVEMRWSLLFPALLLLVGRLTPWVAVPASAALTLLLGALTPLGREPYFNTTALEGLTFTLYFMSPFVAGIALALHREALARLAGRVPGPARALLWAGALALLGQGDDLASIAGAALVIALALDTPEARAVLGHPLLQWLGRISYSLYLTHVVVLGALVHALHGLLPWYAILALAVPASLAVAQLSYRAVERPSMAAGRWLTTPGGGAPTGTGRP